MRGRGLAQFGIVVAVVGVFFLLQGMNVIRWPASSFMVGRRVWVDYGAAIAVAGLLLVLVGRRR